MSSCRPSAGVPTLTSAQNLVEAGDEMRQRRPISQIIREIPRDEEHYGSRDKLGRAITERLFRIWESEILSDVERAELDSPTPAMMKKLDKLILRQAETLGWRLCCSELVLLRFRWWEGQRDGVSLFVDFGRACAKSAQIFQNRARPPIDDPGLYELKKNMVAELRTIQRTRRKRSAGRKKPLTREEMVAEFKQLVSGMDGYLHSNFESWMKFLLATPIPLDRAPATLWDTWFGWCSSYDPETVRKAISSTRSK